MLTGIDRSRVGPSPEVKTAMPSARYELRNADRSVRYGCGVRVATAVDEEAGRGEGRYGSEAWMRDLITSAGNLSRARSSALPPFSGFRTAPTKLQKKKKKKKLT